VVHKNYENEKSLFKGTDISLAAVQIDRSDPFFNEQQFSQLQIPTIDFLRTEELENLKKSSIRVVGYPIEIYDPKSGGME